MAILVNAPPAVSITAPAAIAGFNAPATITISADATDTGAAVTKIDFYQGTILIGAVTAAPYSITWSNVAAGQLNLDVNEILFRAYAPGVVSLYWLGTALGAAQREAKESTTRIGVLGSGLMGGKLGTSFARAGHEVVFSYARSEQKLKTLAHEAKGKARHGTPREAAQEADAILLAVHWSRMNDVLHQAGDLSGKVVVTCSLPMNDNDTDLVVAHTSSGAEELAKMIPKARVVSAFNTVPGEVLFDAYQAKRKASRPGLVYCGDDRSSKELATGLIRDVGFEPVDAGPLQINGLTVPGPSNLISLARD